MIIGTVYQTPNGLYLRTRAGGRGQWTEEESLEAVKKELQTGKSAKETSAELAELSGWNKKEIYGLVNRNKGA